MQIQERLKLIRLRQRRMAYVLLGLVPLVLVAGYLGNQPSDAPMIFVLAAVASGALLLAYSLRLALQTARGAIISITGAGGPIPWTQRCLHCGLPLKE